MKLHVAYKESVEGEVLDAVVTPYGVSGTTVVVYAGDYCAAIGPLSPEPVEFVGSDTVAYSGARSFYFATEAGDLDRLFTNFRCWTLKGTNNMGVYPMMICLPHEDYENDMVYLDSALPLPTTDPGRNSPNITLDSEETYITYSAAPEKTELIRVQLRVLKSPIISGTYDVDFKLFFAWEEIP